MSSSILKSELAKVDWAKNVSDFFAVVPDPGAALEDGAMVIALWSKHIETMEATNPALPFVREMQTAAHSACTLIALGLYKPAAASMRVMLESGLAYSYFRLHPAELATLVRDPEFYLAKEDYIDYHKQHTCDFVVCQNELGVLGKLRAWYSRASSVIHGQVPGKWTSATSIGGVACDPEMAKEVVHEFVEGTTVLHRFFLCVLGRSLWPGIDPTTRSRFLKGISAPTRKELGLTLA